MIVPKPRKLKSGTWFIYLRLGGEGVSITGGTEKECVHKAELAKAQYLVDRKKQDRKPRQKKQPLTLEQCIDKYIKSRKWLSPSTVRGYEIIKRNRFQSVMKKPVPSIKNWQEVYDRDAESVSPKTMKNAWNVVNAACAYSGYTLPKIEEEKLIKHEHDFLTPDQIKSFIKYLKTLDAEKQIPPMLALCSLRLSEILALTWENVDTDRNRILVSGAAVINADNKLVLKAENKTASSRRYVPILIPELKQALINARGKPPERVVPVMPNTVYRNIKDELESAKLPPVGVHGLRHSFASLAHHLEIPPLDACKIGGWSDVNTLMKIYTHLDQKDVEKYSQKIMDFFKT